MLFYLSAVSFDNISIVDYLLFVFASLILSVTCIGSSSHFGHRDFPALAELYTTSYEVSRSPGNLRMSVFGIYY